MSPLSFILILFLIIPSTLHSTLTQPKDTFYHCELEWMHENYLGQFHLIEPRILTCIYKCKGFKNQFKWAEEGTTKGCKYKKKLYIT